MQITKELLDMMKESGITDFKTQSGEEWHLYNGEWFETVRPNKK